MAIAYHEGTYVVVFIKKGEITPLSAAGKSNPHWGLIAVSVLSEKTQNFAPIDKYVFHNDMLPAVARILSHKCTSLEIHSKTKCLELMADVLAGVRYSLHEPIEGEAAELQHRVRLARYQARRTGAKKKKGGKKWRSSGG